MTEPSLDGLRRQLFELIDATPWLDWLLLTKRPENILRMWPGVESPHCSPSEVILWARPNVWLGTSIAEQADADRNIPLLLKCRDLSPVLFLSAEPLIGPIDLRKSRTHEGDRDVLFVGDEGGHEYTGSPRRFINWVIVGGESGPGARPCTIGHVRDIVRDTQAAGVPVFVKQLGKRPVNREGQPHPIKDKKGGDMAEWPEDLRLRQFPEIGRPLELEKHDA
jgi:protein gp37